MPRPPHQPSHYAADENAGSLHGQTDIGEKLATFASAFERYLERKLTELPYIPRVSLSQAISYSLLGGGKRIRPFIIFYINECGATPAPSSDCCGAALEILHSYSLVHDDLPAMDDDKLRRGKATTHVQFCESTAILAGDAMQALAFELLASDECHPSMEVRNQLVSALAVAAGPRGMALGQAIDLAAEQLSEPHSKLSKSEIEQLQRLKTGKLFGFAFLAGAILSACSKQECELLTEIGELTGIIFQNGDDLLDIEGDEKQSGKKLRKDQSHHKATLVDLIGADKTRSYMRDMIVEIDGLAERSHFRPAIAKISEYLTIIYRL